MKTEDQVGVSRYSLGEEIAHSVTHGVGLLASIAGLVVLVVLAALHGEARGILSASIFGTSLVAMYLNSTLYHGLPWPRAKRLFRKLDHAAIFLLIAGTYTPFTLVSLGGGWGWSLFGVVWGLALAGVLMKVASRGVPGWISLTFYLCLGWLAVIAIGPLSAAVGGLGLTLILLGGLAYSVGAVFYAWRGLPYNHAVWHLFVLTGSTCHFFAVLRVVSPGDAC